MICKVSPNVTIKEQIIIGNQVIIESGTVIGSDGYGYTCVKDKYKKTPHIGTVLIEDEVELGSNISIDRATIGKTRVGAGTKIGNLTHIAHNVDIGIGCLLIACIGIAGSSKIGNFVIVGGQAGIRDHVEIGDHAQIFPQTGVPYNIKPSQTVIGNFARPLIEEKRLRVLMSKLPQMYKDIKQLKKQVLQQ